MTSTQQSDQPTPTPTPPRRHLAVGTLLTAGAQISPIIASAGLGLAIARLLGPSGTGVASLVANLFNIVALISGIGLGSGITYLVSRREWSMNHVAHDLRLAAAGLGIAGAACGLAFYLLTRHTVFRGVSEQLAIVSLASLPFALAWSYCGSAALGRERYEANASFWVVHSLVLLICGIALALPFGLTGAIVGYAAANVVTAVVSGVWIAREAARDHEPAAAHARSADQLRRATKFGVKAWSANLLQLLNYRLDIFVLSAVATRSAVGVYSVAVSLTAVGWLLPDAFQTVLFPRVAGLHADVGLGRIGAETSDAAASRAVRHAVLTVIPTSAVLAGLVLIVPLVYGPGFRHSVSLGFILIPGVAALGTAKVLSAVFTGRGFPQYSLYATLITAPITLALYFALIPILHATGAAVASTTSYVTTFVLSVVFFRKATGIPLRAALIPSRSDLLDYVDLFRLARARLGRI